MARNNFSFQTVLKLNSKDFERGINDVKRALAGLKSAFLSVTAALGAGLGFSKLISNMKDTAQSLSVAKAVLKNVSTEIDEAGYKWDSYASNLEYVRKLSNEYGQDLTNLIEGFGQFHAAANQVKDANGNVALSLKEQKYIYEQLTKAAAGYHMSADRTKDMMNAVTQMMSKGKVAAEELRRQLGNALPGAFGLMAQAMGVSTMELEDMMRSGKLMAADALPKFARELEKVTEGMSFDSLQNSLNRLRSSWTELVESASVERMYKGIIDAANGILKWVKSNMSGIKGLVMGALSGIASYITANIFVKGIRGIREMRSEWVGAYDSVEDKLKTMNKKLTKISKSNKSLIVGSKMTSPVKAVGGLQEDYDAALEKASKYNQELLKMNDLYKKVSGRKGFLTKNDLRVIKDVEKSYAALGSEGKKLNTATLFWGKAWGTIRGYVRDVFVTLKGMLIQMTAMAAIGAIVGIITKWRDKQKEIKEYAEETAKIYTNYEAEMKKIDNTDGDKAVKLKNSLGLLRECEKGSKLWLAALQDINTELGLQGDDMFTIESKYDDIVKAVQKWIDKLKIVSKINRAISKEEEYQEQIVDVRSQIDAKAKEYQAKTGDYLNGVLDIETGQYNKEQLNKGNIKRKGWIDKNVMPLIKRLKELKSTAELADAQVQQLTKDLAENYNSTSTGDEIINPDDDKNKNKDKNKKGLAKVVEDYTKEKKELENKLNEHAITQEQYNDAFDKLVKKYWDEAAASGEQSIDKIIDKMDKGKTLTKMEKWYKDLYDTAKQAAFNATMSAAQDAIDKSIDEAIDEADEKLNDELQELFDKWDKDSKADLESLLLDKPKRGKRDSIFDYKKSSSEIFGEEADVAKDWADEIKKQIDEIESKYDNIADASEDVRKKLKDLKAEYALASKEAASLEEAMKIRQIMEDIDELNKTIDDAVVGGIKNLAESTDRVIKGLENIAKVFDDEDNPALKDFIDGWEKFMAIFNEVVQIIEMFTSISETLNTITKTQETLDKAELAMQQQKVNLLEKEIAYRQALLIQKQAENKETEKAIAANITETAVSKGAASANASEAVAGATASGAKLPFPYNLVAIAAGIAAVVAALANMGKFAKGGIIGGNSYSGDKQMARVNSGEMILNKHQQGMLFNAINSGKLGGGNVQFKIRGTDLIGVINNENSRRRG